jgi:hypothetical protein
MVNIGIKHANIFIIAYAGHACKVILTLKRISGIIYA